MKYISEKDLRAHLITDNCDDGCGYLDERDIPSLPWIELVPTDDDALDKIRAEITDRPSLMMATSEEYERGVNAMLYQALSIIDKYREVKE